MNSEDKKRDHFRAEKERRFVFLLIIRTFREVVDLCKWYHDDQYESSLRYILGIHKTTNKQLGYERASREIKDWTSSDTFEKLCQRINYDAEEARILVTKILDGEEGYQRIEALTEHYWTEESAYAVPRGPEKKATQQEGISRTSDRSAG